MIILAYLLWVIAAMCNVVMDAIENENFSRSIFARLNPKFWYKRESWRWAPHVLGWKLDAWHLAKSIMILCIAAALCLHEPRLPWFIEYPLLGLLWNVTFRYGYKFAVKEKPVTI